MECFVSYCDDHWDNGGVGLGRFKSRETALAFINTRLANSPKPNPTDYLLIEGNALPLAAIERVTRIEVTK